MSGYGHTLFIFFKLGPIRVQVQSLVKMWFEHLFSPTVLQCCSSHSVTLLEANSFCSLPSTACSAPAVPLRSTDLHFPEKKQRGLEQHPMLIASHNSLMTEFSMPPPLAFIQQISIGSIEKKESQHLMVTLSHKSSFYTTSSHTFCLRTDESTKLPSSFKKPPQRLLLSLSHAVLQSPRHELQTKAW